MRLELVRLPDALNGGFAHPLGFGHGPTTPMRAGGRLGLQGGRDNGRNLFGRDGAFAPPPRRHLPQRLGALFEETPAPQGHRLGIGPQTRRDGLVLLALGGRQNNAAAERNLLRGAMGANPALELQLIGFTQSYGRRMPWHGRNLA